MKSLALILISLFAATYVSALGVQLLMPDDVAKASLIVRVTILDSNELPRPPGVKDDDLAIYYHELSRARITDSAKGGTLGEIIEIEHNNGLACPNVVYLPKRDCIVFLRRLANGHFETMNFYCGCFDIGENGLVDSCYLFGERSRLAKNANPDDIVAELRKLAEGGIKPP